MGGIMKYRNKLKVNSIIGFFVLVLLLAGNIEIAGASCVMDVSFNDIEQMLYASNDTVYYTFGGFKLSKSIRQLKSQPYDWYFNINKSGWDTIHPFTTLQDTLIIKYSNCNITRFYITNGSDTVRVWFNFFDDSNNFNSTYQSKYKGKISIETPMFYEASNIILALTDICQSEPNLVFKGTAYYKDVMEYFEPFTQHDLIGAVNKELENDTYDNYYKFRDLSVPFEIQGSHIICAGTYNAPYRWNPWIGEIQPLVNGFLKESRFSLFYNNHSAHYKTIHKTVAEYLDAKSIWTWLENEFPNKYDAYKVIISPLVSGAHSTKRFSDNGYNECVIYINTPEYLLHNGESKNINKGIYEGIFFTEVDHNYINPISDKYKKQLKGIFDNDIWSAGNNKHYNSSYSIFNEYMTHAVYCIYINQKYSKSDAAKIIAARVNLMESRRGFIKFDLFYKKLEELYGKNKTKLYEIYPNIIAWAQTVK